MANYQLTAEAAEDVESIFMFGIDTFGTQQAISYQYELKRVFALLAENPLMGRRADGAHSPIRRHQHGSHRIFYKPTDDGIVVAGIIHMSSLRKPGDAP